MVVEIIKKLCEISDVKLMDYLYNKLLSITGYKNVIRNNKNSYLFAEGTLPICLIAHLDTVFVMPPEEFFYDKEKNVLWSPYGSGFDDRAGVYAILEIINQGYRPSVLFTTGEERGGIGAEAVISVYPNCPFRDCRALIELDRGNEKDSIYYRCANKEFEKYINSYGFTTAEGTFTDISKIAPAWKIAAVNLSVGYVDEHTSCERLYGDWLDETIRKVCLILKDCRNIKNYEYIPEKIIRSNGFQFNNFCLICGKFLPKGTSRHVAILGPQPQYVCDECKKEHNI